MNVAANNFTRILVIDDDPVLRTLVEQYFIQRSSCCDVLHASDGIEALEHLKQQGPLIDLVVSDLNMPKLDGIELLTRLKEIGFAGPIIILSGTYDVVITMANEIASQLDLNIAGVVHKPFSAGKLDDIINAM